MPLSPMMVQYMQIKEKYNDCILFYRLGDFYEMFFSDAELASKELDLTLTGRDCGLAERAPMCGVPYHACESYINKLIMKGYKVAICEQTSDPAQSKGLVKREIVRVITPGTVIDSEFVDQTKNNYIAAFYQGEKGSAVAFADLATGQIHVFLPDHPDRDTVNSELYKYSPSEMLFSFSPDEQTVHFVRDRLHCMISSADESAFSPAAAKETVSRHFAATPRALEQLLGKDAAVCCLGGLLSYLYTTQFSRLEHLVRMEIYNETRHLELDISARRNLELCATMRDKKKHGSLLGVLDKTQSKAGSRLLRRWMEQPLTDRSAIDLRLDAVGALVGDFTRRTRLRELLGQVSDTEHAMAKVMYETAGGRELLSVGQTLAVIPEVKDILSATGCAPLQDLAGNLDSLGELYTLLCRSISEKCPVGIREGGIIREGYDPTVDELHSLLKDSRSIIAEMERSEREKTGIRTLKIGYNKVFGYYIEVSKSFVGQVPENYIRRQTLTTGERYITSELKELENHILGASEKVAHLEYEIFCHIRAQVAGALEPIQRDADLLAQVDALCSLAEVAEKNDYIRPEVNDGTVIELKDARHPVVEMVLRGDRFVPNDTYLDTDQNRLLIITGPNMAGKSTYMRQIALITLMAQMGSFVPAREAKIGIVDRIFTRVGASDDLASGQSTFMLEMSEVAEILKKATPRSLIIYDEIGRGTSTYDGMAIARAVLEYTVSQKTLGAKCVFATHYHELSTLEGRIDGVKNYRIAVKKRGDEIIFLRKIVAGAADESYGIEVAKLAGVPQSVIDNAKQILQELLQEAGKAPVSAAPAAENSEVMARLRQIAPETLSPLEALNLLYQLTELAKKTEE